MKIVLDSNVLVAAFATQGLCHGVFELCLDRHEIVLSEEILQETAAALQQKIHVPPLIVAEIMLFLKHHAHYLIPKADYLVTGDKDLTSLKEFERIPIVSPREFWNHLKQK